MRKRYQTIKEMLAASEAFSRGTGSGKVLAAHQSACRIIVNKIKKNPSQAGVYFNGGGGLGGRGVPYSFFRRRRHTPMKNPSRLAIENRS